MDPRSFKTISICRIISLTYKYKENIRKIRIFVVEKRKRMDNKLIARVRRREKDFNLVREALDDPQRLDALRLPIGRLQRYLSSGQWLKDFEADERGELPKDMPRGVLSEDGLYNLLAEVQERLRSLPLL